MELGWGSQLTGQFMSFYHLLQAATGSTAVAGAGVVLDLLL